MNRKLFVALVSKILFALLFICFASLVANGQKIIVDTASTSKYLIKKDVAKTNDTADANQATEEVSFGDRALSIGNGILNRLKARLNLEEAAESIREKGARFTKDGEKQKSTNNEGG